MLAVPLAVGASAFQNVTLLFLSLVVAISPLFLRKFLKNDF
jgi:hypothetical protein